jgi:diacylglycerol kinase (ATP)
MMRRDICVILNPAARAATADEVREIVGGDAEIWTTERPRDGIALAGRAVAAGFATVIAAGGDGTLNEVVNGLVTAAGVAAGPDGSTARSGVVCGLLPLGTGNDFARTIAMPREPAAAWQAILERRVQKVDVVALERGSSERWFINMAVGGAIDQFQDKLTEDVKQRWGPLAYLRAGAEALATLLQEVGPHRVEIRLDDGDPIALDAWSVAVANGRTVGGGIPVAPLAEVADGLLDVVAVPGVRGVEMAKVAAAVLLGKHVEGPADGDGTVLFRRARTVEVRSSPPMPFTTDGEVNSAAVSFFTAHAGALGMIVGPGE